MRLQTIIDSFRQDLGLSIKTSAELEFYLAGGKPEQDNPCLGLMLFMCQNNGIPIAELQKEDGERQYEVALPLRDAPAKTAEDIRIAKHIITEIAETSGLKALFAPKPFPTQPGCGLHLHLSLYDTARENVFVKDGDEESAAMLHAIGGLLAILPEAMVYFVPEKKSYLRFTNPDKHTPTHICWGGNNRTAAVRIPASTLYPEHRHIELRVPGMDADPEAALAAALAGIHHGLTHKLAPAPKLYGNATDPQYGLTPLPRSLKEAKHLHKKGSILKNYFA